MQRDAVVGSLFSAAGVTGAGVLPGSAAPVTSAAPSECSSVSVPTPDVVSPVGAASATGSASRHEHSWESPRSERHRRRSSDGKRPRSGKKHGEGRSPSPARPSRLARASASFSSASSDAGEKARAMPPPPVGHPGMGGGRSGGDRSASDRDRSPQPGPSGLGSVSRSSPGADRSRSEYGGRSSPAPSGAAEDDCSSAFDSVYLDRDNSFRFVLRLIRDFHSLEEPASVAPNRCKTSLAPVYGLQSEFPALHLPLSPLLQSLLNDLTRLWPSSWRTRPYTDSFLFPVVNFGSIIGLPPPLFLVRIQSRPVWPRSPSRR